MKSKNHKAFSILTACLAFSLLALGLILASCDAATGSGPGTYSGYRVIYNVGEGQGVPPYPQTVAPGNIIELPTQEAMTHPTGKVLSGWNAGGTTYPPYARYVVNSDVNFTAQWMEPINTYTVTFGTGEGGGAAPASIIVAAGNTITLPSQGAMTAPSGKRFDGWKTGSDIYASGDYYRVDRNVSFTAQWTENSGGETGTPGLAFALIDNNTAYKVSKGTVTSGAVVIPASYNGLPVREISEGAFGNTNITSVTIPSSVKTIGPDAFGSCTSLTSVTLSTGLTTIEANAFHHTSFTSINIPSSVTSIGERAFEGCTSLTSVNIPSGVTSISQELFYGCTSLTSIIIPPSVKSIGAGAFMDCASLTSIIIPFGITSVGTNAFYGWNSNQTINVQGHASQESADAAWGDLWRLACNAVIRYWNGNAWV